MAKSDEKGLVTIPDDNGEEKVDHQTAEETKPDAADPAVTEPDKPATLEGKPKGLKGLWYKLTGNRKRAAYSAVAAIVVIAAVIGFTPLKYTVLGWAFKSSLDVRVTDGDTGQLLPGAVVKLAGVSVTTDKTGIAHFTKLHPGSTQLSIAKPAYEGWLAKFTLGFGNQGTRQAILTSTGIKVTFNLTDYVSGKAVSGARVQLADADAVSGKDGSVVASVSPENDGKALTAKITSDGYNDLSVPVTVKVGLAPVAVKPVPSGQVYFLSNRTGTIDLYGSKLDGTGVTDLLPGTGKEDGATGILPNVYDQSDLALVSSRAGHVVNGQLQEDLYVFRPASKTLTLVDNGVSFYNFRTWLGKVLVYYQVNSSNQPSIHAYDPATGKNTTIVTCTSDNACPDPLYATDDLFFYSMTGAPQNSSDVGIFVVKSGTVTAQSLSSLPANGARRPNKNTVLLNYYNYNNQYPNGLWQTVDLEAAKVSTLSTAPINPDNRTYIDSPGDKLSASIDTRDGQTDLYVTNLDGTNERQITTTGTVSQFVQWYGDNLIVYSSANQLFVVSTDGGEPHKITNFYSGNVQTYGGGSNPNY